MAKGRGVDIQKKGSGNIGFTNSLRVIGRKWAIVVLLGDVLKGFLPAILALQLLTLNQAQIVAFVAVLAHVFPVWLKFKGGKGIATGLGATLALNPGLALGGTVIFLLTISVTKIVSLSSLTATWTMILFTYIVSPSLTLFYLVLAILTTWAHRGNIKRLTAGTEKRIIADF